MKFGALVQLVRIHACHAWGHGFESRTHRFLKKRRVPDFKNPELFFFMYTREKTAPNRRTNTTISQIRFRSCEENKAEKGTDKNRAPRKKIVFYTVIIFPQVIQNTRHIIENMSEIF